MARIKSMECAAVAKALKEAGCTIREPDKGPHTTYNCPCGLHRVYVSRGKKTFPVYIIASIIKELPCLPEGWLQ